MADLNCFPSGWCRRSLVAVAGLALVLPGTAGALQLGGIEVHSSIGEPLHAEVRIRLAPEESLDPECMSLGLPRQSPDTLPYLTSARFSIRREGAEAIAELRSSSPVTAPVLGLFVRVACPGRGEMFRDYRVLVDPPTTPIPSRIQAPAQSPPVAGGRTPIREADARQSPAIAVQPTATRKPVVRMGSAGSGATAVARPGDAAKSRAVASGPAFRLKLSTGDLDMSVSARIDDGQREVLKAYRRLVEADDQVARMLELEDRVRALESHLAELRRSPSATSDQPGRRDTIPLPDPESRPGVPPSLPPVAGPGPAARAPVRPSPAVIRVDEPDDLARYVRGVAGTVLVTLSMLAAWHVLRRRPGLRQERLEALGGSGAGTADALEAAPAPDAPEAGIDLDLEEAAGDADAQHLILSDAELFTKLGRPESAIGLLRSEIERSPDSPRLWEALAKLLGSLSRARELDTLIGECRRRVGPDLAERIAAARSLLRQ